MFDGVDATGILRQSEKSDLRIQISLESIAEFRVNSALYSAEFGGTAGGQGEEGSDPRLAFLHGVPIKASELPGLSCTSYLW